MRHFLNHLLLFVGLFLSISSCHYFCDCEEETSPCLFTYDQLLYTPGEDSTAAPNFEGMQADGTFSSSEGLMLNPQTGEIDISTSIPGEYTVVFTLDDGETSCETKVVIGEGEEEPKECAFSYGKDGAVFTPTDPKSSYFITPVFEEVVPAGSFSVEPEGLDFDTQTGTINVNTSESGIQYYISYTATDGSVVCETSIVIGGIDYLDSAYVLADGEFEAVPIVDAIVEEDRSAKGAFDETALFQLELGEGQPSAAERGLAIDNATGVINLRQTVANFRELGIELTDGFTREFEIFYTLDPEPTFLNSTRIQVYYFESYDKIPAELLALLREKRRYPINGREEKERPSHVIIVNM